MSDDEKFELINNVWKPPLSYEFPLTNKRKFPYEWLRLCTSLCYSRYLDGSFCLSCVLFGRLAVHKSTLKKLKNQVASCQLICTSNFMATREIWDKFLELFYKIA